ncbi:MAG: HK97 gp10 family phage protein [Eubacteriales bacterium]|nr:HK97 gp10 family phage protein [Eubacteriales bacterium]
MNSEGLETVAENLEGLSSALAGAIARAVQQAGEDAAGKARQDAPTRGAGEGGGAGVSLKNSITAKTEASGGLISTVVRAAAPHAQYVEFGTGWAVGHNCYTVVQRKGLNKKGEPYKPYTIKGWIYPIKSQGGEKTSFRVTQGMAPRPFMRPAMEMARPILRAKLQRLIKRGE